MGGGVVLTHDGLEVPHCEEKLFDGATDSVLVLRQRHKIPPYLGEHAVDVKLDLVEVKQALGPRRIPIRHTCRTSAPDHLSRIILAGDGKEDVTFTLYWVTAKICIKYLDRIYAGINGE